MRCSVRKIRSWLPDNRRCIVRYAWYPGSRMTSTYPGDDPSIDLMSVVVDGEDCLESLDDDTRDILESDCWDDHVQRAYHVEEVD